MKPPSILTINGGSSSLKFAQFEAGEPLRLILDGSIARIGLPEAVARVNGAAAADRCSRSVTAPNQPAAAGQSLMGIALLTDGLKAIVGEAGLSDRALVDWLERTSSRPRRVHVSMLRAAIKSSPEFDPQEPVARE